MVPTLLDMERRMFNSGTLDLAHATQAQIDCAAAIALVSGTVMGAPSAQRSNGLVAYGGSSDNTNRVLDMHEPVHRRMVRDGEASTVARITKVEVRANHALVASGGNSRLARITLVARWPDWALVLHTTRITDVATQWARKNRAKALRWRGIRSDGRLRATGSCSGDLRRLALWWTHSFEGVRHICMS